MLATHHRIIAGILRRLGRIGLLFDPELLVREGMDAYDTPETDPGFEFVELGADDLEAIMRLRPEMPEHRYADLLATDHIIGYGLKDGDKLIAKMWLDTAEINARAAPRALNDDEAYLFDAYSDPDYRGQNLAPYLRVKCYEHAKSLGRSRIYSITVFTNTPARRFKAKLGARNVGLVVYYRLFRKYEGSFFIWKSSLA